MPRVEVYIEDHTRGGVIAHAPDLWGCHLLAEDRFDVVRSIPDTVKDYIDWRRDVQLPVTLGRGKRHFTIAEELPCCEGGMEHGDAAFLRWDARPMTHAELDASLTVHAALRRQVESLIRDLDPMVMQWHSRRAGTSVYDLISKRLYWGTPFLSRLGWDPYVLPSGGPQCDRLEELRREIAFFLRDLDTFRLEEVIELKSPTCRSNWTVRKFIRRLCELEINTLDTVRLIIRDYQTSPHIPEERWPSV